MKSTIQLFWATSMAMETPKFRSMMFALPSGNLLEFAIENGPFVVDLPNLKMVIFPSYASLPEGKSFKTSIAHGDFPRSTGALCSESQALHENLIFQLHRHLSRRTCCETGIGLPSQCHLHRYNHVCMCVYILYIQSILNVHLVASPNLAMGQTPISILLVTFKLLQAGCSSRKKKHVANF